MDQLWHLSLGGASCVLVIARGVPAQLCAFASAGNRSMVRGNLSSKLPEQRNLAHAQAAERVATPASQTLPLDCYFEVTSYQEYGPRHAQELSRGKTSSARRHPEGLFLCCLLAICVAR